MPLWLGRVIVSGKTRPLTINLLDTSDFSGKQMHFFHILLIDNLALAACLVCLVDVKNEPVAAHII